MTDLTAEVDLLTVRGEIDYRSSNCTTNKSRKQINLQLNAKLT